MRYLCLLIGEPDMAALVPGTPEFAQMLSDYESAMQAMAADGVLVDSGALQPPAPATTLRVRDGRPLVTDGPFAEAGEAYRTALALDPPPAEREFLAGRLASLDSRIP